MKTKLDLPPSPLLLLAVLWCLAIAPLAAGTRVHTPASIPSFGGGAALAAKLFAPDPAVWAAPYPVITMLPGGGAGIDSVEWAATRLAETGYVSIITLPASGGSTASYNAAARSGLDFLASPANPFLAECDLNRTGACGWSLGARSLTRTQQEDTRIDCLVAWDNLAISESGDAGSPSGAGSGLPLRTPRVPALGQASEMAGVDAQSKLTAFNHWRAAGVPTAQISLAVGSTVAAHLKWGTAGTDAEHDLFHYYTQAWFDRWLKNDASGIARLTAPQVLGSASAERLSTTFLSGLYADGIDTSDLRTWLLAASGNLAPRTFAPSATDPAITLFDSPHYAFFNPATPARGRLFLFLPGTDATPSVYQKICRHAAVLGWHSLGLTYQNGDAVNALCPTDPQCAGLVRAEVLDGIDRTPLLADGQPALARVWTAMLTAPLQPPGLTLERTPSGVRLGVPSTDGLFYTLQQSTNLTTWTQAAASVIGTGLPLEWSAPIDLPSKFWRVQVR